MRVRHKQTGIELEIKNIGTVYYITAGGSCIHRDDQAWEFVKEEWEDVTTMCTIADYSNYLGGWWAIQHLGMNVMSKDSGQYRIRKVQVNFPAVGHQPTGIPAHCGWAFVIERKKV